jgi:hypothetical protein
MNYGLKEVHVTFASYDGQMLIVSMTERRVELKVLRGEVIRGRLRYASSYSRAMTFIPTVRGKIS